MKQLLTGKCLEDFEICFEENTNKELDLSITDDFFTYPLSMQFGVIQGFGDSVEITMDVFGYSFEKGAYNGAINDKAVSLKDLESLEKAREETIKQFNKIYNEKH